MNRPFLLLACGVLMVALVGCSAPQAAPTPVDAARPSPEAQALSGAMAALAPTIPYPVFYPTYLPAGYQVTGAPSWSPPLGLETGFSGPDKGDLTLIQRSPTPVLMESARTGGRQVPVGDTMAWARDAEKGANSATAARVSFLRDGTWVHLDSFVLPVSELIRVAASLQPVPGSHAPVAVPGVDDLAAIRRKVAFAVLVPLRLPQGLTYSLLPEESAPGQVNRLGIAFRNQFDQRVLYMTQSAADRPVPSWVPKPMRELPVTALPSGPQARFACRDDAHCTSIWWVQDGTYLAMETQSGYTLPLASFTAMAASMSATALLDEAKADLPAPEPSK